MTRGQFRLGARATINVALILTRKLYLLSFMRTLMVSSLGQVESVAGKGQVPPRFAADIKQHPQQQQQQRLSWACGR